MSHTQEPWNDFDSLPLPGTPWSRGAFEGTARLSPSDYNRAASCVNACSGMADPAAEIAAMRRVCEAAAPIVAGLAAYDGARDVHDEIHTRHGTKGIHTMRLSDLRRLEAALSAAELRGERRARGEVK